MTPAKQGLAANFPESLTLSELLPLTDYLDFSRPKSPFDCGPGRAGFSALSTILGAATELFSPVPW